MNTQQQSRSSFSPTEYVLGRMSQHAQRIVVKKSCVTHAQDVVSVLQKRHLCENNITAILPLNIDININNEEHIAAWESNLTSQEFDSPGQVSLVMVMVLLAPGG